MTAAEKREKLCWFIIMIAYFSVGYLSTNWIASHHSKFLDVSMAFEGRIPFIPVFIVGYVLVYIGMYFAYASIDDIQVWRRGIILFFLATTTCYLVFIFFPVKMEMRPDISSFGGVFPFLTKFFYKIDLPYNCFPSLHVTYPMVVTLLLWNYNKKIRWFFLALVIIMMVSVILVKQHYIADVLAGPAVASACYWITLKTEWIWNRWFRPSSD